MLIGATLEKTEIGYWKPKLPENHIMRIFPDNLGNYRLPPTAWTTDDRYEYCEDENVIPFVSSKIYKPTTSEYDGIAALALLKTYFENLPSWVTKIYYTNIHEPEGDTFPGTETKITATEFKTWHGQIATMLGTLDPAIRAKIHYGPALTRQYTENTAGRTYDTWDPGPVSGLASGLTEFFGVDFYGNSWAAGNTNTAVTVFVPPATILSKVKVYKKSDTDTRPRYFPEIGYIGAPFDTGGQARAQWMAGIVAEVGTWNSDNPNWTMPWEFEGLIFWNTAGKLAKVSVAGIGKSRWFQFDRRHNGTVYGSDPIGGYTELSNSPIITRFNEMVAAQEDPDPDPDLDPEDPDPDEEEPDPDPDTTVTTFVATPEPDAVPPRILLELEYTGQATATITRLDPDGRTRTVRLGEPATLSSDTWVGYDYESWLDGTAVYTAATSAGNVSTTEVTLASGADPISGLAWLRHPGIPSLSVRVEILPPLDERTHGVNQSVQQPLGRRFPVVISDGRRKAATSSLTFRTFDEDDAAALRDILDDVSILLLDAPQFHGLGFTHEYLAFGELRERRFDPSYGPNPWRNWTIPYTVVDRPAGGQLSQRTWATLVVEQATWATNVATYDTWSDTLTGAV